MKILADRGGIDLDRRDAEGNTPLYHACRQGYRDVAALLLERGADPSLANNRGETPLHAAARSGNREIIDRLMARGADPDAADNEGCTPLMRLLESRRTDAALWLIDHGADTARTDRTGHRALDYATAYGLREVVVRLSRPDDDARDAEGNTPLHQAVYNDCAEVCAHAAQRLEGRSSIRRTTRARRLCSWRAGAEPPHRPDAACGRGQRRPRAAQRIPTAACGSAVGQPLPRGRALLRPGRRPMPATMRARRRCLWRHAPGTTTSCGCSSSTTPGVNTADNLQHTALYYAGERGFTEIVELLLAAGAEG